MPDPTSPFHDPHAEPVRPIRLELDDRTLDPFAGLEVEEMWEVCSTPRSRALVDNLMRSGRTPHVVVQTPAEFGDPLTE